MLINISSLIQSLFPIGGTGLTTYISRLKDENKKQVNYLLKYFFIFNFILIVILIILIIPFAEQFSIWLLNDEKFYLYIILFGLSLPFLLTYTFVDLYLRGIREINTFVLISSIGSIIGLIVFVSLVFIFGLTGAIIGFISYPLINSILSLLIIRNRKLFPNLKETEKIHKVIKNDIIKVGLSSVVIIILQNIVYLFIRTKILASLGEEQVGLFQSVHAISNNYFSIFFSLMCIYSIPRLSELRDNASKIKEINTTLKFMLLLYTPMIIIFYVFRLQIIPIFYSESFLAAEPLLFYQLIGDFFKVLSWVMGLWLIPSLRIREWFIFELFYYAVLSLAFYFLITYYIPNILYASIAYLVSYFLYFILQLSYILYKLKFRFDWSSTKVLTLSAIAISLCFIFSRFYYEISIYVFLLVFPIWAFFVLNKADFLALKGILKNKNFVK
jgi:PST family polysaccharide transporter